MARFTFLFALTLAACAYQTQAAPLGRRQDQCEAARDQIVNSLIATNIAITDLTRAVGSDPAAAQGVSQADDGVLLANAGVNAVVRAIDQGRAPSQAAGDQLIQGLEESLAALSDLEEIEEAADAPELVDAQSQVEEAIDAAELVLEACGAAAVNSAAEAGITGRPALFGDAVETATVTVTETVTSDTAAATLAAEEDLTLAGIQGGRQSLRPVRTGQQQRADSIQAAQFAVGLGV